MKMNDSESWEPADGLAVRWNETFAFCVVLGCDCDALYLMMPLMTVFCCIFPDYLSMETVNRNIIASDTRWNCFLDLISNFVNVLCSSIALDAEYIEIEELLSPLKSPLNNM